MNTSRRRALLNGLFGAGWVGLRALATGLPVGLLAAPRVASADSCTATSAQYLVLVTSYRGDPMNANVPGCYASSGPVASVYHPPGMASGTMTVGGATVTAGAPWATLDPTIMSRTSFLHHGTYTNAHGDAAKVNELMGATMRQEMLVSLLAQNLGACLGTVQLQPVVLSANLITYTGAVLPVLSPPSLRAALAAPDTNGPLTALQKLRDSSLDELNALYKTTGNKVGRAMLDQYALSQQQVRNIGGDLLDDLASITGNTPADLATATAVLFKMNVSSVAVFTLPFGGDNHADVGLVAEAAQQPASVNALFSTNTTTTPASLVNRLRSYTYGNTSTTLWDKTTVVLQNVFGRTLNAAAHNGNTDGRHHNSDHHCTVLVGSNVKSSLVGGIALNASSTDFRATGIDSTSGASDDGGDITYEDTLASVGKTIGRAVGVPQTVLDAGITQGKTIPAALVTA